MRRSSMHLAAAVMLLGSVPASALRAPLRPPTPEPPAPQAENYYQGRHRAQWKNETNKRGRNR